MEKIKAGWFTFTCCEDSTMMFLELLGYHKDWLDLIEFKHFKQIRTISDPTNLDVAFVEGAICSEEDIERLKDIRKQSKYVVAIGSCACQGKPSAMRNYFDKEKKKQVEHLVKKFNLTDKVYFLKELIKVDFECPGCPMIEKTFLKNLYNLFDKFGLKYEADNNIYLTNKPAGVK